MPLGLYENKKNKMPVTCKRKKVVCRPRKRWEVFDNTENFALK
jgi:hypothetical protein